MDRENSIRTTVLHLRIDIGSGIPGSSGEDPEKITVNLFGIFKNILYLYMVNQNTKTMNDHKIIVMTKDFGEIKKGTKGTILFDYGRGMYEVEFMVDGKFIIDRIYETDFEIISTTQSKILTYLMVICSYTGVVYWMVLIHQGVMKLIVNHFVMTEIFKSNVSILLLFVLMSVQIWLLPKFFNYYKTKYENHGN